MELPVHIPQVAAVHVRIDLRGRDVRVPKHLLDGREVRAALEQMRSERVAERVRRDPLRDPRTLDVLAQDLPDAHPGERPAARVQENAALPCPALNNHAGITPKYRGMNGGYWALATGDAENFGTTVHLVDAGVDTGAVLHQVRGKPGRGDNIALYALRLAAMSREICVKGVEDTLEGRFTPVTPDLPSKQWYHPTIWFYLWTGLTRGVW
jgi:hypothetical protein